MTNILRNILLAGMLFIAAFIDCRSSAAGTQSNETAELVSSCRDYVTLIMEENPQTKDFRQRLERNTCFNFVVGWLAGLDQADKRYGGELARRYYLACPPEFPTPINVARALTEAANNDTDILSAPWSEAIHLAMTKRYRCQ